MSKDTQISFTACLVFSIGMAFRQAFSMIWWNIHVKDRLLNGIAAIKEVFTMRGIAAIVATTLLCIILTGCETTLGVSGETTSSISGRKTKTTNNNRNEILKSFKKTKEASKTKKEYINSDPNRHYSDRPYAGLISRYAKTYGVPASLAHAVIKVESGYRAQARGRHGEIGLMQIKPATARMMGYRGSARKLYKPEINIRFGMKYLGRAHRLGGGSTCRTILKYNAGHAAKRMNPISKAYCRKVRSLMK